jgi:hypothetical protein
MLARCSRLYVVLSEPENSLYEPETPTVAESDSW